MVPAGGGISNPRERSMFCAVALPYNCIRAAPFTLTVSNWKDLLNIIGCKNCPPGASDGVVMDAEADLMVAFVVVLLELLVLTAELVDTVPLLPDTKVEVGLKILVCGTMAFV